MTIQFGVFEYHVFETLAICTYLSCLIIEYIVHALKKTQGFVSLNTFSNIITGITAAFSDGIFILLCTPVLLEFQYFLGIKSAQNTKWLNWIYLFILIDFLEYAFHVLCHKVNVFWNAHLVHHEDHNFNLTVGLRSSIFIPIMNLPFYLIPVIVGFHPRDMYYIIAVQGLYQLLIHTQLIGKLKWLDMIIVTPSAHRVHHGSNNQYIDKNFGKVLLIWDQLFGTFAKEDEKVVYGIPNHRIQLHPVKAQINPWKDLIKNLYKNPSNTIKYLFGPPSKKI